MNIRSRLLLLFQLIALLPVIVVTVLTITATQNALRDVLHNKYKHLAQEGASSIKLLLDEYVHDATQLANQLPLLRESLLTANQAYSGQDENEIDATIKQIDNEWISTKGKIDFARNILGNPLSIALTNYAQSNPQRYGEIFLTDRRGATVAMTKILSDYDQSDEAWWQHSFDDGRGKVFLDDRGYDESINALAIGVVVPVFDQDNLIGILKINHRVSALLALPQADQLQTGGSTYLARSRGDVLIHSSKKDEHTITETEKKWIQERDIGVERIRASDGSELMLAHARIPLEIFSRVPNPGERKGISGERWEKSAWHVFINIDSAQAFAPVKQMLLLSILFAFAVLVLAGLIAIFTARSFSRPIQALHKGTEILARGDLNYRLNIQSRDEIGELANAFNSMAERLSQTLASREKLEHEIEQRKQAQEEILQNQLRLKQAEATAHLGHWDWDINENKLYWSDEIYNIFGLGEENFDATYEAFMATVHPDDRSSVEHAVNEALYNYKPYTIEHRIVLPDGKIRYVLEQGNITFSDQSKPVRMFGTVQDVTELRSTQQELAKSEREWIEATEFLDDAIYLVDLDDRIVRANRRFYELIGLTPEQTIGQDITSIIHPDGEAVPCPVCRARRERRDEFIIMEADHPDNPTGRPIQVMVRIIRDESSEPMAVLMGIRDLTERREAERILKEMNTQLEQRVAERTEELKQRVAEVERINRAMSGLMQDLEISSKRSEKNARMLAEANAELESFVYSVSHDLRAPLRSMQGFSTALMEDYAEILGDTGADYARRIAAAAQRMDDLILDLLDYSRIIHKEVHTETVDLRHVFEGVLESLKEQINTSQAQITADFPVYEVQANQTLMQQVLLNLISNALKFVAPDTHPVISVWSEARNGRIRLWVEDNGIGIDPQVHEKIFRIFERLHGIETYHGTGIGLAVVAKAIQRQSGDFGLESELGKGSRFWVELPSDRLDMH